MNEDVNWIRQNSLYDLAMLRVGKEVPKFTKKFWRLVLKKYEELGGRLGDDADFGEDEERLVNDDRE